MDVESYEDGYVSKLLVQEGGSVNVSSATCDIYFP